MHKVIGSQGHIHQYDLREFKGRVFATSDTHGCFDLLHHAMRFNGFDTNKDLLFVGGDLCDRGAYSSDVLDYLTEPWFIPVCGNHEDLFIKAHEGGWDLRSLSTKILASNGGEWALDIPEAQQQAIYEAFKTLPLGIELLLPGDVKAGIVHACVPYNNWEAFKQVETVEFENHVPEQAMWSRTQYSLKTREKVLGIDFVLHGHNPTGSGQVEKLGNRIYMDLGSFFRDKLSFMVLDNQFTEWAKT